MVGNRRETGESTLQISVKWLQKRVTVRHFWSSGNQQKEELTL
jgi:hypothetical protein